MKRLHLPNPDDAGDVAIIVTLVIAVVGVFLTARYGIAHGDLPARHLFSM